jgi:hypothetical protein
MKKIQLTATNQTLEIKLAAAVDTAQLDFTIMREDFNGSTTTPGQATGTTN